ncbi:TetR/AcrR family transcriptional regulator [Lysinibacillus sp. KU-BSD001]|uniref:TetR/AcrR family transcriptional regulator n=1 Tax=Lysinibacillus sp. KU-BSD001 TaxID=3141328 RepID=UPI0036E25EC0
MAASKQDRRVVKTKKEIRQAFTTLLEEKSFDAITVQDLTERANINRGTFYLHYQDKYDLLEQCEDEILEKLREIGKNLSVSDLRSLLKEEMYFPLFVRFFECFQENAPFMRVILGPNGDPSFHGKMKQVMLDNLWSHFISKMDTSKFAIPIDILTTYVSSAHLGVVQHWLNEGMKQSPKEITAILIKIITKGPLEAVGLPIHQDSK